MYVQWRTVPSAATESTVDLPPPLTASTFVLKLTGAVPGANFDFTTFPFHIPTCGLTAWASAEGYVPGDGRDADRAEVHTSGINHLDTR